MQKVFTGAIIHMEGYMKIIHCADLHLGSKMEAKLPHSKAMERRDEILRNFDRLAKYATLNGVQIVLIAGDLLDSNTATLNTREYVLNVIKTYENLTFVYLCGNHDQNSLLRKHDLPKNLINFSEEWQSFDFDENICITGKEGKLVKEDYDALSLNENKFNIVTLHGQEFVGQKQDGEIINLNALKNKNINYLALGHIHSFKIEQLDERGIYAYSGCLEGRGFDECGPKGFVLLDIKKNNLTTTFVPFAKREIVETEVNITNLSAFSEILKACTTALAEENPSSIVRIVLTGTFTPETDKSLMLLQHELENRFYFVDIKDKTELFISPEIYENSVSLAGEFIKQVKESNLDEETKAQIITQGLRVLKEAKE